MLQIALVHKAGDAVQIFVVACTASGQPISVLAEGVRDVGGCYEVLQWSPLVERPFCIHKTYHFKSCCHVKSVDCMRHLYCGC